MYYSTGCWTNDSDFTLTTPDLGLQMVTSDSSPDSILTASTARTSPPKSPMRSYGALLLPKVRAQDQVAEPIAGVGPIRRQKRGHASGSHSFQSSVFPYNVNRPSLNCRGISPARESDLISPASVNTTLTSPINFSAQQFPSSRRASSLAPTVRASSVGAPCGHSRSGSNSSLDDLTLARFGYPTYRQPPVYMTSGPSYSSNTTTHLPEQSIYNPLPQVNETYQLPQNSFGQVQDFMFSNVTASTGSSSVMSYLSSTNPAPSLVRRVHSGQRNLVPHFWFDVRNLRQWKDFSMTAVNGLPDLLRLIQMPVDNTFLPTPDRLNSHPETDSELHDIYAEHFCTKINAALQMTQGSHHMKMTAVKPQAGARPTPDFISNYPTDAEKTFQNETKGRIVGLVKAYDDWNTGLRSQGPVQKIQYLKGLAHLHRVMREHGCRYGFIINEIELLCVRAGGLGSGEAINNPAFKPSTPIFGYLETATPIQLSTKSTGEGSTPPLTAGLALWYLHMLAKDEPLPGAGSWRMEVEGAILRTRANCIEKDDWIPKPILSEKREAKRFRGWVMPEDPFHRKELPNKKNRKQS